MSSCKIPKKASGHPHKNIENGDYKTDHMPHQTARATLTQPWPHPRAHAQHYKASNFKEDPY